MLELLWEDCTLWSKSSLWGQPVSGKCLVLNKLPLNDHITKVYGLSLYRKCLLCLFSQKLLRMQDLSVLLPQQWCRGRAEDLQFFTLTAVCQVSVTGWEAASIYAPCHHKSVEDNAAVLLYHVILLDSDHDAAVRWTEACSHFLFPSWSKKGRQMGLVD